MAGTTLSDQATHRTIGEMTKVLEQCVAVLESRELLGMMLTAQNHGSPYRGPKVDVSRLKALTRTGRKLMREEAEGRETRFTEDTMTAAGNTETPTRQPITFRIGEPERCTVTPALQRRWWQLDRNRPPAKREAVVQLVVVTVTTGDKVNGKRWVTTRARMSRREGNRCGLKAGAIIVLQQDVDRLQGTETPGTGLRYATAA